MTTPTLIVSCLVLASFGLLGASLSRGAGATQTRKNPQASETPGLFDITESGPASPNRPDDQTGEPYEEHEVVAPENADSPEQLIESWFQSLARLQFVVGLDARTRSFQRLRGYAFQENDQQINDASRLMEPFARSTNRSIQQLAEGFLATIALVRTGNRESRRHFVELQAASLDNEEAARRWKAAATDFSSEIERFAALTRDLRRFLEDDSRRIGGAASPLPDRTRQMITQSHRDLCDAGMLSDYGLSRDDAMHEIACATLEWLQKLLVDTK